MSRATSTSRTVVGPQSYNNKSNWLVIEYLPKDAVWNVVIFFEALLLPVMTVLPFPSPINIRFFFFLPTFKFSSSYLKVYTTLKKEKPFNSLYLMGKISMQLHECKKLRKIKKILNGYFDKRKIIVLTISCNYLLFPLNKLKKKTSGILHGVFFIILNKI